MYTIEDCPHFMCQDCKYFKINADREESLCKRIDHKKVRFHKNPFSSYHCGEHHIICRDFEPKHPEYADFKTWEGVDDYWNTYIESWHNGKTPKTLTFHVGGDYSIDYIVPFELFFYGGMIEGNILNAIQKRTTARDKVSHGVQLYKIKEEDILGVNIETGEYYIK